MIDPRLIGYDGCHTGFRGAAERDGLKAVPYGKMSAEVMQGAAFRPSRSVNVNVRNRPLLTSFLKVKRPFARFEVLSLVSHLGSELRRAHAASLRADDHD